MIVLLIVLLVVYVLAVNFYSFMLMLLQKKQSSLATKPKRVITDGKILLSAVLGGALSTFISTFLLKYRRDSILIMVVTPLLVAIQVFIVVSAFTSGFWLR